MSRKKVNSTMVARRAGVSQTTVSMVANLNPRISPATSQAVIRAARELGYPLLPQNRTRSLALLVTTDHAIQQYQASLFSAAFHVFSQRNIRMDILSVHHLDTLNERAFSGAVSLSSMPELPQKWQALSLNLPLIRLTQKAYPKHGIWSVYNDPDFELQTILRYLRARGHTKIAMYLRRTKFEEEQLSEQTGRLFRQQLKISGLEDPDPFISYSQGVRDADLPRRVDALLQLGISALICIPGESTLKILNHLNRIGVRVPDDLSIVSREIPGVLDLWSPGITAYAPDYIAHMECAADLIDAHYRHLPMRNIAIPGTLIERQSVKSLHKAEEREVPLKRELDGAQDGRPVPF